jgi:hypothetical protein
VSRVKRRSAWVLVGFSQLEILPHDNGAADPRRPRLEIDVWPSQGAELPSSDSGSGGEAEHGGEVVIAAAGLDEPLPVSR